MEDIPYALLNREAVLSLPRLKQVPLLWEALVFIWSQRGKGELSDQDLDRNESGLSHALGQAWYELRNRLRDERAWENLDDPRWPMNHKGEDADHLYKSGVYPPACLCCDASEWGFGWASVRQLERMRTEFLVWADTPVGLYTLEPGAKEAVGSALHELREATIDAQGAALNLEMFRLFGETGESET